MLTEAGLCDVAVGRGVVDAESVGGHGKGCLVHELPECGDAAGDAGDAVVGLLAEGLRAERLAGAIRRRRPVLPVPPGMRMSALRPAR
jgi:hypothetical protein